MAADELRQAFIQDFGVGYQVFGLSRLMGHIMGLMLCEEAPQSLDAITERLSVSKGPVSQITRRLSDHQLLRKAWVPGSRRDHYEAVDDVFGQAYANIAAKQARNLELANNYRARIAGVEQEVSGYFQRRVEEMAAFYELMLEHQDAFMEAWRRRREELAAGPPPRKESP
jgi:DNA-binding transcriptional regulator GbsR (MarR family)